MRGRNNKAMLGAGAAIFAGTFYGFSGTFSQLAGATGLTVTQVCLAQYLFATLLTALIVFGGRLPRVGRADALKLAALGFVNSFGVFTYYLAIERLSVAAGVAIQFQYVWIAVVIQCVAERVLPKRWTLISALLIMVGTVMGSGMADELLSGGLRMDPAGLAAAMACACIYASFLYGNTRIAVDGHPLTRTFYICAGGLVAVTALTALTDGFAVSAGSFCLWGCILAVVGLVAPVCCLAFAGSRIGGGLMAILTSTELPVAVLSGAIVLGEPLTVLIAVGVVVIVGAIALSQLDGVGERPSA